MAARTFWKGYLTLSRVTCPVSMIPATTEGEKVRFHTLNAETGNRVVSQYVDAVTQRPVREHDQVKGYQRGEDDHVILEDEEIEAVALDSTRTIDIGMFVPDRSIGWVWYDTPHFLMPGDGAGQDAFAVIRDAMATTGTAGLSRLVMYRRERAVMLKPRGRGIVLWTLRFGDEIRDEGEVFDLPAIGAPESGALDLMRRLIGERTVSWDAGMVDDPVQDRLLDIIAAKKKAKRRAGRAKAARAEDAANRSNVIDIMEALTKSLGSERGGGGSR
ncbi:Ku protein [Paracoccus sediminis]|uniref:Non-homologous end joining protein Ku n=1 Tax=Paracoccus sediminis TaxID=1214787 RepID=A0A238WNJ1_9RHOB|nr:Ku protein [Paracoccus sediminis]TBN50459.1 Ku protein [Paracoccus sediminis]SNR47824.1 DNA end-binding protein Ku [Paracoccus sediminis]